MTAAPKAPGTEQKLDDLSDAVEVLGDDVDALSLVTEGGFEETHEHFDKAHAQLDAVEGKVKSMGAKVDKTLAATGRVEALLGYLVSAMWGAGGLVGLGLAVAAYFFTHGTHPVPPAAAPPAPRVTVNVGTGSSAEATQVPPSSETPEPWPVAVFIETGEKLPPERYIPNGPLPGQMKPPCDALQSHEAINGGCWAPILRQPPCGRLYRQGNICYSPIAANPKEPVGTEPNHCDTQPRAHP